VFNMEIDVCKMYFSLSNEEPAKLSLMELIHLLKEPMLTRAEMLESNLELISF